MKCEVLMILIIALVLLVTRLRMLFAEFVEVGEFRAVI